MVKTSIGVILMVLGGVMAGILFAGGGPLLPHIIGPIVLVTVGVVLITVRGSAGQFPEH